MKKMLAIVLTMVLAVGAGSIANAGMKAPGADAGQLHEYLTKQNPYEKWKLWPGKGKLYKGTEPHGELLTTYVNDQALKSIKAKKGLRNGSIIVKENYMPNKMLGAVTVMYKIKGYNPDAGDIFWMKYTPDGKIEASGKVDMCIGCHAKVKGNDYLFTGKIK